jgi:hypothetical protein
LNNLRGEADSRDCSQYNVLLSPHPDIKVLRLPTCECMSSRKKERQEGMMYCKEACSLGPPTDLWGPVPAESPLRPLSHPPGSLVYSA